MKKIITLMVFLGIVSAISGGLLAAVNEKTAPIIAGMAIEKEKANLELIFPDTTYEVLEFEDESGLVSGVYQANDQGYIFKAEVKGYSATPIVFMVGIDDKGAIAGFKVLSHSETSGIGTRIETDEYLSVVLDKTANDTIDTLGGATVSSKAVGTGIEACFAVYNDIMGLGPVSKPAVDNKPKEFVNDATIQSVDGNSYVVNSKGFAAENEVTIVINNGIIESVMITAFNDVLADGTSEFPQTYYDLFKGLKAEDITMDFDVVSGSTVTSKSVLKAILKATEEAKYALGVNDLGDTVVYTIEGEGYTFEETGKDANIFKVTLNKAEMSVVSVEVLKFNDTKGLGDLALTEEHLATFTGKTLETLSEVDVVSGATVTSNSVTSAVKKALTDLKGGE